MMNLEYRERIHAVMKYIRENSTRKLTLDDLAYISNFSKYHFSRIFTAVAGITPAAYVNRVRVQKAVKLLGESQLSILDISSRCGFESLSAFNAAFKKHCGQTPSEVRKSFLHSSNFPSLSSNKPEESAPTPDYNISQKQSLLTRVWEQLIRMEELKDFKVACVRHVGSYLDTYQAWDKLRRWSEAHGISPDQQYIGISLDDVRLNDEMACRYDACVTLPAEYEFAQEKHSKEAHVKTISGGLYAVYPYDDTVERFVLAYQNVYALWLPSSGYEADDRPSLEFCLNDPAKDPEGKCKVDLYVPVKKRGTT